LGRATIAGTSFAVLTLASGCEIVSGLNDIMVPEAPGDERDDGAPPDAESGDETRVAGDAIANDASPGGDERDDGTASLDAAMPDAPDASMPDAASFDASDGPCVIGRAVAHDETATLQGTFQMGADADAGPDFADAVPRHPATLGPFALDKFEVSVAKFRVFVDDYACWRGVHPAPNEGAVAGEVGRGWQLAWTSRLVSETELRSRLACDSDAGSPRATWTEAPDASSDERPIDCVTWYEALAFCIWDGGRLPTEAEWEFAAAGGAAGRPYPSGFSAPFPMAANYDSPAGGPVSVGGTNLLETFGTRFLAGNVAEWVFDGQGGYKAACTSTADCETVPGERDPRGVRGGSWSDPVLEIRTARRTFRAPTDRSAHIGFRCARDTSGDR
jgi:sulfatase modifying factor 1